MLPVAAPSRVRLRLLRTLVVLLVALLTLPVGGAPASAGSPLIGGYFIYASSSASETRAMLDSIKSTGANTVVTFGTRLRPASLTGGRPAVDGFAECQADGTGCVAAVARGKQVRSVFTYTEGGTWHANQLQCGDRQVTHGGKTYTVLLVPASGSGSACGASQVDVVVSLDAASASSSKTAHLLSGAFDRGMRVFVGMPAPIARTSGHTWLPDTSYLGTLGVFTARWMENLKQYDGFESVVGVYHHTEMPLSASSSWDPVLDVYRTQARAAAVHLPGRAGLVSPYIDARRSSASATKLEQVPDAVRRIADAAGGMHVIVAPQDGQGTGKVGAYSPDMAGQTVDAPSAAVAGAGSYAQRYYGSTGDYMRQVVAGAAGRAEVWVNIELMTATTSGAPVCDGASNGRGKADLDRVRRQVGVASVPGVSSTIGFMWTPYVTCGPNPLLDGLRTFPSPTHVAAGGGGGGERRSSTPRTRAVSSPVVAEIQQGLATVGYPEVGAADGFAGPRTKQAVSMFQTDAGHPVTGAADEVTLEQVRTALTTGWTRPTQPPAPGQDPAPTQEAPADPAVTPWPSPSQWAGSTRPPAQTPSRAPVERPAATELADPTVSGPALSRPVGVTLGLLAAGAGLVLWSRRRPRE